MNEIKFINKLKKKLYSKKDAFSEKEREHIKKIEYDFKNTWGEEKKDEKEKEQNEKEEKYFKFMKKKKTKSKLGYFLLGSFLFFLFSFGIGVYFLTTGSNLVSSKNVKIVISGPPEIKGGAETSLQVSITNQNNSALEVVDMIVYYPEGSVSKEKGTSLPQKVRRSLGDMKQGEVKLEKINAVFFGEKGEEKELKVEVEYRIEGSNAIFSSENFYPLIIESSPLSVSVEGLDETVSGKELVFKVLISSNSDTLVEDVVLNINYPFGFEFSSSDLKPSSFGKNLWQIGNIPSGGEKEIEIRGVLKGQESEERVFNFNVGIKNGDEEMKSILAKRQHSVLVKKPFLGVNLAVNGSSATPFKVNGEEKIRVDISWKNNTTSVINNAKIEALLIGNVLDEKTISVDRGFYNSYENKIVWSKETDEDLSEIKSGEEGNLSFTFDTESVSLENNIKNPKINIDVGVYGKRVSDEGRVPENIESSISEEIFVTSLFDLAPRALYYSGPFENSGPIPPKVGEKTEYAIVWVVTNSSNDLEGATVSTSIPSYVNWGYEVEPESANIKYNDVGGVIDWDVGNLKAGEKKEVSFKIVLKPSLSQIGTEPIILRNQTIKAFDTFSKTDIEKSYGSLNTELSTETNFDKDDGVIIE